MENSLYKTKDLAEAAALIVQKIPLKSIERNQSTCWFVFENKPDCEKFSNMFFFGELLVNAREFHEAITRLKNRIFSRSY